MNKYYSYIASWLIIYSKHFITLVHNCLYHKKYVTCTDRRIGCKAKCAKLNCINGRIYEEEY